MKITTGSLISPKMQLATLLVLASLAGLQAELRVPGFTGYLDPDVDGGRISGRSGVVGWNNPKQHVLWFGEIKTPGKLDCSLALQLPAGAETKLRLTVGSESKEITAKGGGAESVNVSFGSFQVAKAGYQRFTLQSLNENGKPAGDIDALILDGEATKDAHFNLKPRRNAASVHLAYPTPAGTNVEAFYCEATGVEDPVATYYMACGWHRGYFGMQVNSATERRIIFSVWDSGKEAVSRSKVGAEDRVTLVAKGEGVDAGDFGNEGTGGHSHLVYNWKTGEKQRFIVTAKPTDTTHTIYSGYWFHPDKKQWMIISSWKAPKDGSWLRGLYSFSENFGGDNGHLQRKALFGNQWLRTDGGTWIEQTTAKFSHDPTGQSDRLDRFMGVENGQFFLSNGGFVPGFTTYGDRFERPATGKTPADIHLPELPKLNAKL